MGRRKLWKLTAAAGAALVMLFASLYPANAAQQADISGIVAAAAEILYNNEGSYESVNPNDNGAVSVGKLQWHGWRALSLLRTIVLQDEVQAKKLLGNALYNEVVSSSDTSRWASRKLTAAEALAVKNLLLTAASKEAQDTLAVTDITNYIEQGQRLGIVNEPALVYFADLANQGGSGAAGRVATSASRFTGSYAEVTLNELHAAAICDSVMGNSAYHSRRFKTYDYAAELGWPYCAAGDSYIPNNYTTAKEKGISWVRRSLNTCMDAGLAVSGSYDSTVMQAVSQFQSAKKISVDGYAGKDTIVALIKTVFNKETVAPGAATNPQEPDSSQKPGSTTEPGSSQKPGNTTEPGSSQKPGSTIEPGSSQNPGNTANPGSSQKPGSTTEPGSSQNPGGPSVVEPQEPENTRKKAVLKSVKASYAVNETSGPFDLQVASNHAQSSITYQSSDKSVVQVSSNGKVTVKGAGSAVVTAAQAQTSTYTAAELKVAVTVYSLNPDDYTVPTGALYDGKNMQKAHVQWLQAALAVLDKEQVTVNGKWSKTLTKQVTAFQEKCGIYADGIVGTQTRDIIKQLLAVRTKKPVVTIKCNTKANTLSWKQDKDANRIYVYRKEKGGAYKRLKTITNMAKTSYKDTKAEKGKTYYYVVKYGCLYNKVKAIGPSSKGVAGKLAAK